MTTLKWHRRRTGVGVVADSDTHRYVVGRYYEEREWTLAIFPLVEVVGIKISDVEHPVTDDGYPTARLAKATAQAYENDADTAHGHPRLVRAIRTAFQNEVPS